MIFKEKFKEYLLSKHLNREGFNDVNTFCKNKSFSTFIKNGFQ